MTPEQLVRAHLTAFDAGDLDRLLATLAPTARFVTGTESVDPADFAEFFGWAMSELAPTIEIVDLLVDGSRVACRFVETVATTPGGDGARRRLPRAAFYRVEDDLIVDVKVYDERD